MKQADTLIDIKMEAGYILLQTTRAQTRVWFMGDGIVRARTSFDGVFAEDSLSLVWTCWPDSYDSLLQGERIVCAAHTAVIEQRENQVTLTEGNIVVTVCRCPFSLSFSVSGETQLREVEGRAYSLEGGQIRHSFCLDDSHYYGFGEKTGTFEKTGTTLRMSNKDACGYDPIHTDPLYKHVPYFVKLSQSGNACGVYYNHSDDCCFDIGREYNGYWPHMGQFTCEGADIDLFFIAGPLLQDVVRRFTRLTGRPAMAPASTLGYLGSTMYYSELPSGCDKAILNFVERARREGIPCSNFQLSSGYTTDAKGKRNVFTWNYEKFPYPARFVAELEAHGATVTPNIKPGILLTHPCYAALAEAGVFITGADGTPYLTQFWGGEGALFDFSNPAAREIWGKLLCETLIENGIRSVWNDNNEFEISDREAVCHHEGNPIAARKLRAQLPMLMAMASRKALETADGNKRIYQVTRSGNAGISRYAQTWTGDNSTSWDSLQYNIATVLGAGISGMANTGADVGGFAGPAPEPELFVRWIWYGVLQPRFSIHSANSDNTVTEPWMYAELLPMVREAFALRRRLTPYLYSLLREANRTGAPIVRPMVYEFQQDKKCRCQGVDFMLGSSLLAACVVHPGAKQRTVYLPQNERFYDFKTRADYQGGQTISLPCPWNATPLLLRAGGIVPLQEESYLNIIVCPAPQKTAFTLYEDDGISNDYQKDVFLSTQIIVAQEKEKTQLLVSKTGTYCPQIALQYEIQCDARAPYSVAWNGNKLTQFLDQCAFEEARDGWYYDPALRTCAVKCGDGRNLTGMEIDFEQFDLIRM